MGWHPCSCSDGSYSYGSCWVVLLRCLFLLGSPCLFHGSHLVPICLHLFYFDRVRPCSIKVVLSFPIFSLEPCMILVPSLRGCGLSALRTGLPWSPHPSPCACLWPVTMTWVRHLEFHRGPVMGPVGGELMGTGPIWKSNPNLAEHAIFNRGPFSPLIIREDCSTGC